MSLAEEHFDYAAQQQVEFHGEDVNFRAGGVNPETIPLKAIVTRGGPQSVSGTRGNAPALTLWVRYHATLGLTTKPQPNSGAAFEVAEDRGGAAAWHPVVKAVGQAGGWLITLR